MTVNFNYNGKNMLRLVRELSDSALVDVALRIAETDPVVFARAVLGETRYTCSIYGIPVELSFLDLQYLQGMKSGDKVRAIKWLREKFNIGLKEAKDLCEKLVSDKIIDQPSWVAYDVRASIAQSYITGFKAKEFEEIPDDEIPF
jgi:ribosomal protein L7/L12